MATDNIKEENSQADLHAVSSGSEEEKKGPRMLEENKGESMSSMNEESEDCYICSGEPSKRPRFYNSYTNEFKIEYLKLAATKGRKRAAIAMNVPWSTAKTWSKKDEDQKKKQDSFSNQLRSKLLCSLLSFYRHFC